MRGSTIISNERDCTNEGYTIERYSVVVERCMSTCLFSSSPATSLVWRFKSNAAAAVSDFDMKSVKVTTSSIYVSAQLPSYGVVRTPMHVRYELTNRTDKVQEFSCLMQPSEAFMFSGNKQHNMKVHQRTNYPFQNTTQLRKDNIFQINFTHPTIDPTHFLYVLHIFYHKQS